MNAYKALNFGGIAVVGRSGSGKSSCFFGSEHVQRVIIADTGSMGHLIYCKDRDKITLLNPLNRDVSPIQQTYHAIEAAAAAEEPFALDSFSTLQEMECAWLKRTTKKDSMSLTMHQSVVGHLRDLALALARSPGFTLFNTSPGGRAKDAEGNWQDIPQGCLTGYPALSGLASGTESVLARFSTVLVAFPGFNRTAEQRGGKATSIARGFILQDHDFRPDEARRYCPVKDPMRLLAEVKPDGETPDGYIPVCRFEPFPECTVDRLINSLADHVEPIKNRGKRVKTRPDPEPDPFEPK